MIARDALLTDRGVYYDTDAQEQDFGEVVPQCSCVLASSE